MAEETWKDILAYNEPKGFRPPHWCAVLIEVTIFLLVGISAALLRFTSWASIFHRDDFPTLCSNPEFNKEALSNDLTALYYPVCLIGPFILVVLCEIERSYYSSDPNYKLFTATQRFFYISLRPIGMFVLGVFMVSAITDYIKVIVTLPRPYFFDKYSQFCFKFPSDSTLTLDERYALTSFPCHLSALSAFTTFLAACYIHKSISLESAPLVKPMIAGSLFLLTVTASVYRVNINYNHWADIICGIAIGSLFAYIMNSVLLQNYKSHKQVMTESTWRLLLPRVNLPKSMSSTIADRATVNSAHGRESRFTTTSRSTKSNKPYWTGDC